MLNLFYLFRGRKETASAAVIVENFSDGRSSQNGTERGSRSEHPWSYEEQFKQVFYWHCHTYQKCAIGRNLNFNKYSSKVIFLNSFSYLNDIHVMYYENNWHVSMPFVLTKAKEQVSKMLPSLSPPNCVTSSHRILPPPLFH
jgi:hypothetical protein